MLKLFTASPEPHFLINGFPATIMLWKSEEYDALAVKPPDAVNINGIWVALRMD